MWLPDQPHPRAGRYLGRHPDGKTEPRALKSNLIMTGTAIHLPALCAANTPRPPASETAAASSGVPVPVIPPITTGCSLRTEREKKKGGTDHREGPTGAVCIGQSRCSGFRSCGDNPGLRARAVGATATYGGLCAYIPSIFVTAVTIGILQKKSRDFRSADATVQYPTL